MVLTVMFIVENNVFAKQLRTAIQSNETTQTILKKIDKGYIKEFTEENRFLLF